LQLELTFSPTVISITPDNHDGLARVSSIGFLNDAVLALVTHVKRAQKMVTILLPYYPLP